ncbi:MAG: hypothetical protein AB1352_01980 [Patescibacteria group bacterium]
MNQVPENYTQVLLEEIRSQFKAFGENLELVKEKGDATFEMVGQLTEDMRIVKDELKLHSQILNEHTTILNEHSAILNEHSAILNEHTTILNEHSDELRLIRYELKEKIGRDEFKMLEDRVVRLEKLALSRA